MATRQKRKEKEERELAEAEEFLDERRVVDGKERFWSEKSEVRLLRTLAVEENVANSQDIKTKKKWNPRYPVDAKAELERREAVEKEKRKEEEEKRRKEEEEKRKKEEERKNLRRQPRKSENLWPGTRRPLLKSTNTEVFEVYIPSESDEDEEKEKSKKEFDPFEFPTTSESDEEVVSKIV